MVRLLSFFLVIISVPALVAQKEIPDLWGHRVHDEASVLKSETIDQLEQQLKQYEDSTSNQIAVLIMSSLEGENLEDYSIRVAEKWQLGQKDKDNGVLLLVAVDDHKMRIEIGQGLEGVLTDAQCNRIIRNEIAPNFRRNDYDAGILAGVDGIIKSIGGEYKADDVIGNNHLPKGLLVGIGLLVFIFLAIFAILALFSEGNVAWTLYVILIPFYAAFALAPFAFKVGLSIFTIGGISIFVLYLTGFPVLKMLMNRSPKWKTKMMKWQSGGSSGGGSTSRGGSWSSSRSGGFSGGGGSFGGGGSSGSW